MTTGIGGNNPPDMTVTAGETMKDLSDWMSENPVIEDENKAREAKVYIDRAKLCIKDLEDERDGKVRPLNEQVKEINLYYKGPRTLLERVSEELGQRLASFLREEELRRIEAANAARALAEEAERRAREAERLEQDALRNAAAGELGVDIQASVVEADAAFGEFERANRQANLAERDTKVKIGGGFSRAISLREKETLTITDPLLVMATTGANEEILKQLRSLARAYRKLHNRLPDGVEATIEREL